MTGRLLGPVMGILAVSVFLMDTTNALPRSESELKVANLYSYHLSRTAASWDIGVFERLIVFLKELFVALSKTQ